MLSRRGERGSRWRAELLRMRGALALLSGVSCGRCRSSLLPALQAGFSRNGAAGRSGPAASGRGQRSGGRAADGDVSLRESGGREGRCGRTRAVLPGDRWGRSFWASVNWDLGVVV